MTDERTLCSLEFNKIKEKISEYCVLKSGKLRAESILPHSDFACAKTALEETKEAYELLYDKGIATIEFYDDLGDILERVKKYSTLSMAELLKVARLLKSSRILKTSIDEKGSEYPLISQKSNSIFIDAYLENEIRSKILSEDTMSDNASEKLASLRRQIKRLNEQIREKLASYLHGEQNKYLQESIITKRGDRYVLPVKSEYKGAVGGFVHDQSSTGSTLFIEPTAVLELNNSIRIAQIEEANEIERILAELSSKVGVIADNLIINEEITEYIDMVYAKAVYAYKTKAVMPKLTRNGIVNILDGRHPLIDKTKVVPVSLNFGDEYNYLLISGPNTGGKTVTLKMVGLFALMAASGIFIQAKIGSEMTLFSSVFSDIGDEQSIEENLSTFSSHMKNIIKITENIDENSLVLIDEIGAGTDPEEGGALARAIIEKLIEKHSRGIITTHYSYLKEFAYLCGGIKNASMEFDDKTYAPLYKINIGLPGTSNAIEISETLGLNKELALRAYSYLDSGKLAFENVLKEAEKARKEARDTYEEISKIKAEEAEKLKEIEEERKKLVSEREVLFSKAKSESKRIVSERLEEADAIIEEIKILFDKEELNGGDLIKARTLRNKLENMKYSEDDEGNAVTDLSPLKPSDAIVGAKVYYKPMDSLCDITSVNAKKGECEILIGSIKSKVKISDLYFVSKGEKNKPAPKISLKREPLVAVKTEVNVIGLSADEALIEVERFIDSAIVNNLEKVRIVHGKGLKILSKAIHAYLKRNKFVKEFRFGNYGEGEHGVTIVTLNKK